MSNPGPSARCAQPPRHRIVMQRQSKPGPRCVISIGCSSTLAQRGNELEEQRWQNLPLPCLLNVVEASPNWRKGNHVHACAAECRRSPEDPGRLEGRGGAADLAGLPDLAPWMAP